MNTRLLLSVVLPATVMFATSALADEKIQWSEVPAAVQKTITEHAGGGKIEEIEKETETKGGKKITVYEADVKKPDGKKVEIKVGEDGKLMEIDDD
jgi:uncharacterized membrane protein YkoI